MIRKKFREEVQKNACYKRLGSGAYGTNARICRNKDCTDCQVVKYFVDEAEIKITQLISMPKDDYFKYIINKRGYTISLDGKVMQNNKEINDKERREIEKLLYIHELYTQYLIKYENFKYIQSSARGENFAMYTKYDKVEEDMGKFLKHAEQTSHKITVDVLSSMILSVFLTLDYIYKTFGVLHMDLKSSNILIVPITKTFKLGLIVKVQNKYVLYAFPTVKNHPVIIDFGISFKQNQNSQFDNDPFDGKCYFPLFDMFRWLDELLDFKEAYTENAWKLLKDLVEFVFEGNMKKLKDTKYYLREYGMLNSKGCEFVKSFKIKEFSDILKFKPFDQFRIKS